MKMRQYLPNFIADSFFSVLYLAAVVASFPAAMYSCDALSLPAFLSVTISVEQVRERGRVTKRTISSSLTTRSECV